MALGNSFFLRPKGVQVHHLVPKAFFGVHLAAYWASLGKRGPLLRLLPKTVWDAHVHHAVTKSQRCAHAMMGLFNSRHVSVEVKRAVFFAMITPIIQYSSQAWRANVANAAKLAGVHMAVCKSAMHCPDTACHAACAWSWSCSPFCCNFGRACCFTGTSTGTRCIQRLTVDYRFWASLGSRSAGAGSPTPGTPQWEACFLSTTLGRCTPRV